MFTGIIQQLGRVVEREGFKLKVVFSADHITLGDSVAVNGVCLTVVFMEGVGAERIFGFDLSEETLRKTSLGRIKTGDAVNIELPLRVGDLLGGHFVQGHVDGIGQVLAKTAEGGESFIYEFSAPPEVMEFLVSKGSVSVDGISLTVVDVKPTSFTVSIIPHTESQTTLSAKKIGDLVNLEADMVAKHVAKLMAPWRPA